MRRMAFAVAMTLAVCATEARAESLPLIEGVPGAYTPGTPFSFDVRVPPLADFTSYTVQLIFSTDVDDPPLSASAAPSPTNYPFPSTANFQTGTVPSGSDRFTLSFSDFTDTPVTTESGVNDTLVRVTVVPDATLRGPITIQIGSATNFEHSMEDPDYSSPGTFTVEQNDVVTPEPVPAPPGVVLLGVGGLMLAARSRMVRRSA